MFIYAPQRLHYLSQPADLYIFTALHDIDFCNITLYLISPERDEAVFSCRQDITMHDCNNRERNTQSHPFIMSKCKYTDTQTCLMCTLGCRVHKLLHTHLHMSQSVMHSCKLVPCPPWLFQLLVSIWQPRPLAEWLRRHTSLQRLPVCLSAHNTFSLREKKNSFRKQLEMKKL